MCICSRQAKLQPVSVQFQKICQKGSALKWFRILNKVNLGWVCAGPKWVISIFSNKQGKHKFFTPIVHWHCWDMGRRFVEMQLWFCDFILYASSMKNRWYLSLGIIRAVKNNLEIFFAPSDRKKWRFFFSSSVLVRITAITWEGGGIWIRTILLSLLYLGLWWMVHAILLLAYLLTSSVTHLA